MENLAACFDFLVDEAAAPTTTATTATTATTTLKTGLNHFGVKTYTFDKIESRNRVEEFFDSLRFDYNDYCSDLRWEDPDADIPTFEDWLIDMDESGCFNVLNEYARFWFSCVAYDIDDDGEEVVDENMEIHFGSDSLFDMTHSSADASLFNIQHSYESYMYVYHGSAWKFDEFKKHVNHQFGYCGAVETGYSTTQHYSVAYYFAMGTPPGVDTDSGVEYGNTRYIYSLDFKARVVDMHSVECAWQLEPYKDLLVYFGVQAVNIWGGRETVILDESLMASFTRDEVEYDAGARLYF